MCCCYILHSNKLDRYYVGVTCENLEDRIKKHNNRSYGSHRYTAVSNDWLLFLHIDAEEYSQAIRLERKIKSMKSRKYIENLKRYPDLIEKIKRETKGT